MYSVEYSVTRQLQKIFFARETKSPVPNIHVFLDSKETWEILRYLFNSLYLQQQTFLKFSKLDFLINIDHLHVYKKSKLRMRKNIMMNKMLLPHCRLFKKDLPQQGLFQALMFTTVFAWKIEFHGYCLFWLVTLKAPP